MKKRAIRQIAATETFHGVFRMRIQIVTRTIEAVHGGVVVGVPL
jgi:hypothetical protein